MTLRAEIPNPAGVLFPGLYVRVRLEQSLASKAIVLPQQSLTRSPQGDAVMVDGFQKLRGDAAVKPVPWTPPGSPAPAAPAPAASR